MPKKMTFRNYLLLLFTVLISFSAFAQDYYDAGFIRNENYIYKENIRTVLLFRTPDQLSAPIIDLARGDKLTLIFDDLEDDVKHYKYTVKHCDAYWNDSGIRPIEYIDGFEEDDIYDYKRSFNTLQPYTNYMLTFPTNHLRLKKSGNYILRVYDDYDEADRVIITRRFMVVETLVGVKAWVAKTSNLHDRYTKQQIEFIVNYSNYPVSDPYRDIHVTVRQNRRWDNAVTNISPRLIMNNELNYSLDERIVFQGGNEFRHLDLKTVQYRTDRMQTLDYTRDGYHVYMLPDTPRDRKEYLADDDINGRRLISANQAANPHTGGEYAWTHFIVPYPQPMPDGNFYIFGDLTNWEYSNDNKLIYDYDLRAYLVSLDLKQGYYNYAFAFLQDGTQIGDVSLIEGSHWETENEYGVYVYHRQQGEYYDRLINVTFLNSYR